MRAAKITILMSTLLKSKVPAIAAFGRSGLRKTAPQSAIRWLSPKFFRFLRNQSLASVIT